MNGQNKIQQNFHPASLIKRALKGAGLAALLLGAFFGFIVIQGGELGFGAMIYLPFTTVAIGGAFGGALYYLADYFRYRGGWQKVLTNIVCGLAYFVILWLSLVAALSVTGHWD